MAYWLLPNPALLGQLRNLVCHRIEYWPAGMLET